MIKFILAGLFILIFRTDIYSQCFGSPGNPIAGTANLGTVKHSLLRINLFERYSVSHTYFHGSRKSDFLLYDKAFYNYFGNSMAYGIHKRLTIETETGYFINRTVNYSQHIQLPVYSQSGHGFSHFVLSLKTPLYEGQKHPLNWAVSGGMKAPLQFKNKTKNGIELPVDVQPSTMAWGVVLQSFLLFENSFKGLRYFMINRYEYNFPNINDYLWGQAIFTSLFVSKHLYFNAPFMSENWTAILQLRHEMRTHDYNYKLENSKVKGSGSQLVYIVPQLNYTIQEKWNISILADMPIYKYYNETQLSHDFAITFNLTRDIFLKKTD
jgi:hypothetical protein